MERRDAPSVLYLLVEENEHKYLTINDFNTPRPRAGILTVGPLVCRGKTTLSSSDGESRALLVPPAALHFWRSLAREGHNESDRHRVGAARCFETGCVDRMGADEQLRRPKIGRGAHSLDMCDGGRILGGLVHVRGKLCPDASESPYCVFMVTYRSGDEKLVIRR